MTPQTQARFKLVCGALLVLVALVGFVATFSMSSAVNGLLTRTVNPALESTAATLEQTAVTTKGLADELVTFKPVVGSAQQLTKEVSLVLNTTASALESTRPSLKALQTTVGKDVPTLLSGGTEVINVAETAVGEAQSVRNGMGNGAYNLKVTSQDIRATADYINTLNLPIDTRPFLNHAQWLENQGVVYDISTEQEYRITASDLRLLTDELDVTLPLLGIDPDASSVFLQQQAAALEVQNMAIKIDPTVAIATVDPSVLKNTRNQLAFVRDSLRSTTAQATTVAEGFSTVEKDLGAISGQLKSASQNVSGIASNVPQAEQTLDHTALNLKALSEDLTANANVMRSAGISQGLSQVTGTIDLVMKTFFLVFLVIGLYLSVPAYFTLRPGSGAVAPVTS